MKARVEHAHPITSDSSGLNDGTITDTTDWARQMDQWLARNRRRNMRDQQVSPSTTQQGIGAGGGEPLSVIRERM